MKAGHRYPMVPPGMHPGPSRSPGNGLSSTIRERARKKTADAPAGPCKSAVPGNGNHSVDVQGSGEAVEEYRTDEEHHRRHAAGDHVFETGLKRSIASPSDQSVDAEGREFQENEKVEQVSGEHESGNSQSQNEVEHPVVHAVGFPAYHVEHRR